LSHHASLVLIDGCNECTVVMSDPKTAVYATFVMTVIGDEDPTRAIWPSCPATGWSAGVHKLTSFANGNPLTTPDNVSTRCTEIPGALCIEVHRPKWLGSGFVAANGYADLTPGHSNTPFPWLWFGEFPSNVPLALQPTPLGPQYRNNFSSESPGATVFSSFESMSPTLRQEHWGVHGGQPEPKTCMKKHPNDVVCRSENVMSERNYPCDSEIIVYFGNTSGDLNATGESAFKRQLFYCMIAQALVIKQNIEETRSQNRFGTLVWQLNEIWPTGGWGSLEYGNPRFPGQVLGGRWKPLHHW
jgi:beta-mannosidase